VPRAGRVGAGARPARVIEKSCVWLCATDVVTVTRSFEAIFASSALVSAIACWCPDAGVVAIIAPSAGGCARSAAETQTTCACICTTLDVDSAPSHEGGVSFSDEHAAIARASTGATSKITLAPETNSRRLRMLYLRAKALRRRCQCVRHAADGIDTPSSSACVERARFASPALRRSQTACFKARRASSTCPSFAWSAP